MPKALTVRAMSEASTCIAKCLEDLDTARIEFLTQYQDHRKAIASYRERVAKIYAALLQQPEVGRFLVPNRSANACGFLWVDLYHKPEWAAEAFIWEPEHTEWSSWPVTKPKKSKTFVDAVIKWYASKGGSLTDHIFCGNEKKIVRIRVSVKDRRDRECFAGLTGKPAWPSHPCNKDADKAYQAFKETLATNPRAIALNKRAAGILAGALGLSPDEMNMRMFMYLYMTLLFDWAGLKRGKHDVYYYYLPVSVPGTRFFNTGTILALKATHPPDNHAVALLATALTRWGYHVHYVEALTHVLSTARTAATAAIMSRNMSHNLGSHALANSKFFGSVGILDETSDKNCTKEEVQQARSRLQAFNQYCQGRLDFIARRLSEDGDKPEPMFLVNDVLKGFMTQYVVLDTLLDDNGFNTKNIHFVVHGNGEEKTWKYEPPPDVKRDKKLLELTGPKVDDVLVGVTGGVTGCHALYALLENLLRNAVKYSKPDAKKGNAAGLEVHVEYLQSKVGDVECYRLRLWENLTNDQDGSITAKVRDGLSKDVIDEQDGKPIKGGHGMQEMKLCAEYLADKRQFPSDIVSSEANGEGNQEYLTFLKASREAQATSTNSKPGTAAGSSAEALSHTDLRKPSLRAYRVEKEKRHALVYEMILPNPTLLGLVCVRNGDYGSACTPSNPCVKRYANLEKMASDSAHFGVIVAHDADDKTIEKTVRQIAIHERHTALPYRLMVVTRTKDQQNKWQAVLGQAMADGEGQRFYPAFPSTEKAMVEMNGRVEAWTFNYDKKKNTAKADVILPCRRVHVILSPDKPGAAKKGSKKSATPWFFCGEKGTEHLKALNKDEWNDLILAVYKSWIRAWKGDPPGTDKRWKLLIGFERNPGQIRPRWEEPLKTFADISKGLVDVYVGAKVPETDNYQTAIECTGSDKEGEQFTLAGEIPSGEMAQVSIGFDKSEATIESPFITSQRSLTELDVQSLKVQISGKPVAKSVALAMIGCVDGSFDDNATKPGVSKACLVFDNHGTVFKWDTERSKARFYHKFSGGEMSLYQLLETPPTSPFGSAYYLLSLLEGCLLNVATLDERVADATIKNGRLGIDDHDPLGSLRTAGIHPLFSIGCTNEAPERMPDSTDEFEPYIRKLFVTPNIVEHFKSAKRNTAKCEALTRIQTEGIRFAGKDSEATLKEMSISNGGVAELQGESAPDAIVIHEGITDAMTKVARWTMGNHRRLYSLLPAVVRTSGRGNESRELGNELPFIELNVLSDSVYGSQNKIKLARAVMSASGRERKEGDQR